ncbi:hypothetical protein ACN6MY_13105 [Peribacillus sp. B-H-3]|jgi:hypothetical protein|uniref:hypothetical protein n=1 Tax=Bacillaceae TaxID=186817 RepID=UPI00147A797E|nr:hypothetical protein [Bacillus sp. MUM 13]
MKCSMCKRKKEIVYNNMGNQYCDDCWSVVTIPYDTLVSQGMAYLPSNDEKHL